MFFALLPLFPPVRMPAPRELACDQTLAGYLRADQLFNLAKQCGRRL